MSLNTPREVILLMVNILFNDDSDILSGNNVAKTIYENNLLEVIIALPNDIFYNTGIATYIWVLSNKKAGTKREGRVQLINANGEPVLKKGKKQPDSSLRDTESVPLKEDIDEYFKREVLPFASDAWVDTKKSIVGYEIPFTRYFYKYEAPKPSAEKMTKILELEMEINGSLAEVFDYE